MLRVQKQTSPSTMRFLVLLFALMLGAWPTPSVRAEEETTRAEVPGTLEFTGKNFFATARGSFHEWRVVESHLDLDRPDESFAVVEVMLASVDTGSDRRDEHLRTADFFDVESYPAATARGHSLVAAGESDAGNRLFRAQFDIDLHGVEKTLPGEVEIISDEPMVVEARLAMDRLEFGVGPPASRWNPMSVRAEIPVSIRIEF
jgi:polyisoprenoid-binding protein YceI